MYLLIQVSSSLADYGWLADPCGDNIAVQDGRWLSG